MEDLEFNAGLSYIARLTSRYILFLNVRVMAEYMCYANITHVQSSTYVPGALRGQKRALDRPATRVMSHHINSGIQT